MIAVATALGATVGGAVIVWRRNPRVGSALVNSVVDPRLLQRGLAGGAKSEIGTLEHFGRMSGVRRLTPSIRNRRPRASASWCRLARIPSGRATCCRRTLPSSVA